MIRKEVKHLIIRGIEEENLVIFKFSRSDLKNKLKWEHSKEFEYNSQMYDVVKSSIINDTVLIWCWPDNKETFLNITLDQIISKNFGNNPVNDKRHESLRILNSLLDLFPNFRFLLFLPVIKISYSDTYYLYCSHYIIPIEPPPESL